MVPAHCSLIDFCLRHYPPTNEGPVTAIAWNRAGSQLAIGFESGQIQVLQPIKDRKAFEPIIPLPLYGYGAVRTLAFSGDGRYLLSGSADKVARVWQIEPNKKLVDLVGKIQQFLNDPIHARSLMGPVEVVNAKGTDASELLSAIEPAVQEQWSKLGKCP